MISALMDRRDLILRLRCDGCGRPARGRALLPRRGVDLLGARAALYNLTALRGDPFHALGPRGERALCDECWLCTNPTRRPSPCDP